MKRHYFCSQNELYLVVGVGFMGTGDLHLYTVCPRGKKGLNVQCKLLS